MQDVENKLKLMHAERQAEAEDKTNKIEKLRKVLAVL